MRTLLPLKTGLLCLLSVTSFGNFASGEATLSSADLHVLPEGETITVTGTGLVDATAASMIWVGLGSQFPTTVNPLNDNTLEVVMPNVSQGHRDHLLLVETTSGSTIGIPAGYDEHTGTDSATDQSARGTIVVGAGTVLSGDHRYEMVIVETGGAIEVSDNFDLKVIIAEDGANIDFTAVSGSLDALFLHSPDTVIIGTIPAKPFNPSGGDIAQELTPIKASYGLDTFTVGYPINITIIGDGTVATSPDQTYFPSYTYVDLTATPSANSTFSGWSGDEVSSLNDLEVRVESEAINLTATFSAGWLLTVYDIPGVSVNIDPDLSVYADGQSVTFTATVEAGHTFEGWGGDASGTALSTTVTMDANKSVIPIVHKDDYDQLPQLNSADLHVLPEGETITVTGTGLADATAASIIWAGLGRQFPTTVNPLNDNTLEVVMPNVSQGHRDHLLLVETTSGSTIGIPAGYDEHTGTDSATDQSARGTIVVGAGTVLSGDHRYEMVIVKAGGVFKVSDNYDLKVIIAEDGAVIDFTAVPGSLDALFLHSPDTVIIGTIPAKPFNPSGGDIAQELTSIKASYGLDTFTVGYPINITIIGDGTVATSPDQTYFPSYTYVDLTATPSANSTFSGWSGDEVSSLNNLEVRVESEAINLTATFSAGWLLTVYDIPGISVNIDPDLSVYADGQSVTFTATVEAGHTFEGWGGDASGTALSTTVTMDANKSVIPIVHKDDYDQLPQLNSADLHVLPEGETITVTGTGLADATAASIIWAGLGRQFPTTVNPLNDNTLEVVMPNVSQGHRDHLLLVETTSGSTIGIPAGYDEHTGTDSATDQSARGTIVVGAGTVLSGDHRYEMVIVKAGGVFKVSDNYDLKVIIAEDGAVIDFTAVPGSLDALFLHSPDTVIIGTIPAKPFNPSGGDIAQELTSIKASYGLDTFTVGYELTVEIEGPGSVTLNPNKQYYSSGENIELTATEDPDAYFIRWIGQVSGHDNTIDLSIRSNTTQIARFSTAPDYFSTWRLEHFTAEELADLSISAFDADPDGDSITNAAEYAFGTDPRDASKKYKLKIDKEKIDGEFQFFITYTRPKNALDITYQILLSTDMVTWNFNGDDTDLVYSEEIGIESIDDDNEEVTIRLYPQTDSPRTFFIKISAILFE